MLKIQNADAANRFIATMGEGSTEGDPFFSIPADFYTEVQKGNVPGHSIVHKFGHNPLVGTTFVPLTSIGIWQTPQVGAATTLRIKAGGDANDTAAGTGAREITLEGLDETGVFIVETLATAGASASSTTTTTFIRLFRMFVSESGTYATTTTGSHSATITVENGAGGTDWGAITVNGFPNSQTKIGAFSVPLGQTAFLLSVLINIESTKVVDILFFARGGILKTSAPFDAMRVFGEVRGITDVRVLIPRSPFLVVPALSDIGFMAKVASGTADVDVDFEILLIDD